MAASTSIPGTCLWSIGARPCGRRKRASLGVHINGAERDQSLPFPHSAIALAELATSQRFAMHAIASDCAGCGVRRNRFSSAGGTVPGLCKA